MSNVNGVVEWAGNNKFGGFSIRVDGNFYNSKYEIKCNVGDTVEFDAGTSGKYCNKLRVLSSSGEAPSAAPAKKAHSPGGSRGVFPIPKTDGQRSIIRQNALARAVEVIALMPEGMESREDIAAEAIRLAMEIERYTTGDLDAEAEEKAKASLSP